MARDSSVRRGVALLQSWYGMGGPCSCWPIGLARPPAFATRQEPRTSACWQPARRDYREPRRGADREEFPTRAGKIPDRMEIGLTTCALARAHDFRKAQAPRPPVTGGQVLGKNGEVLRLQHTDMSRCIAQRGSAAGSRSS